MRAVQALRQQSFRKGVAQDADQFDAKCKHLVVEDLATDALVGYCRVLPLLSGAHIADSYAAQFYDVSALETHKGPLAEIGRFCVVPHLRSYEPQDHTYLNADILRMIWGALTQYVDQQNIAMLFGCSSFQGTDPSCYADCFALLSDRYLAPKEWRPQIKSPEVVAFSGGAPFNARTALASMPPLLRTYLMMGGRVSDHAVVDQALETLHVFTGLNVKAVPPARARLLRNLMHTPG